MDKEIIVYVGGFEMPDKNAAAHRVLNLGKLIKDIGKEVVYIGADRTIRISTKILSTKAYYEGFECYAVGYPTNYKEWVTYLSSAKKYIEVIETLKNVHKVIFYNFPAVAMRNLTRYCRKRGIHVYADITEWYSGRGQGLLWGIIKSCDSWYRMHIMHKRMDGMIVISQFLKGYYKDSTNVIRIPVLADLNDPKWHNLYQKSTDVLKLVYVGWPQKKDRIDYLIEALRNVKRSYHLDIVGITKEQYLGMYPKHKKWIENNKNILFHGRVSHEKSLEFVKKANYSCFFRPKTRMSEAGFPTKFVEAICCNTPVITNSTSDLKEYMVDNKNGLLLRYTETKLIARAIENADNSSIIDTKVFDYRKYKDSVSNFLK